MATIVNRLAVIDSEIQFYSHSPTLLLKKQEEKLLLLTESLVDSSDSNFPHCKVLPEEFKGKFKTVGYYGKRMPLAKALFAYSNYSSIPSVEKNIYKTCENPYCFNIEHLREGKKNWDNKILSKRHLQRIGMELGKLDATMESAEEKEAREEKELAEQERELFALFAK